MIDLLLDPVLGIAILWLAWSALHDEDLFRGVILFIAFGLLMAVMWARLGAPDIALAEAVIGAGISGALLISAVARLEGGERGPLRKRAGVRIVAAVAALGLAVLGFAAALRLDPSAGELPALVAANLESSEVAHPVTAVLLNFRAYDTWLEIVVLLAALVAVQALARPRGQVASEAEGGGGQMLSGVVRLLLPLMVLVGGYFLWRGTHAPGGAFQAGAVLGSAGVLATLATRRGLEIARHLALRIAAALGALAFLIVAAESAVAGRSFLEFAPGYAGVAILLLEVAVTVAIALTLTALYVGSIGPNAEVNPLADAGGEVRR